MMEEALLVKQIDHLGAIIVSQLTLRFNLTTMWRLNESYSLVSI